MSRVLLSFVLLLASVSLCAADVPLTEQRIVPGTVSMVRRAPLVVAGDDGFLVVWYEIFMGVYGVPANARVYGADGQLRLALPNTLPAATSIRAVWTGDQYLVVSTRPRGRFDWYPIPSVQVTRLSREGVLIDAPARTYLPAWWASTLVSLAWNGRNALAVVDVPVEAGSRERHLLLLDREGELLNDTQDASVAAVAADGDGFLLLRSDQGQAVAEGDGRFAVVNGNAVNIIDRTGNVLERLDFERPVSSIMYDGAAWVAAFVDEAGRVCTASFTRSADVRRNCRSTKGVAASPSAAAIHGRIFAAWEEPERTQIMTDGGLASTGVVAQSSPATAVDDQGLLVVWSEGQEVHVGGLLNDGRRRDERVLATQGSWPRIAAKSDRALAVFETGATVSAVLLDTSGTQIHAAFFLDLGPGRLPKVASSGDGWLVVWERDEHILAAHVTGEGIVAGVHDLGFYGAQQATPTVGGVPGGYVVAWRDIYSVGPYDSREQRVDIKVQKFNEAGLPISPKAGVGTDGALPDIRCASGGCLLVWQYGTDVFGVDVTVDGEPIAPERKWGEGGTYSGDGRAIFALESRFGVFIDPLITVGGVETFNGRTVLVFATKGRIYVRDLQPRARAVRR